MCNWRLYLLLLQLVLCRLAALKSPRTSSIVQIIFSFWSGNILTIQKVILCLETYILDSILFLTLLSE